MHCQFFVQFFHIGKFPPVIKVTLVISMASLYLSVMPWSFGREQLVFDSCRFKCSIERTIFTFTDNLYVNAAPLSVCMVWIWNGNASWTTFRNFTEFSGVCSSKPYTNRILVHSSIAVHWYKCFPFRFAAPLRQQYGASFTSIWTFSPGTISSGYRRSHFRGCFYFCLPPHNSILLAA